jgi:hypothetical protein
MTPPTGSPNTYVGVRLALVSVAVIPALLIMEIPTVINVARVGFGISEGGREKGR